VVDIGDNIANSLMLDSSALQYLIAPVKTPTDSTKFSYFFDFKRGLMQLYNTIFWADGNNYFGFDNTDHLRLIIGGAAALTTTAQYRDPTAWIKGLLTYDASASPKWNLIVGGVNVGTSNTANILFNTAIAERIGYLGSGANYYDGYLALLGRADGQVLTASSTGRQSADTGQWVNKNYTGTYGTNGFKLDFTNSGALGTDSSGNGNNWTPQGGITSVNQYTDTSTNNYCVLNPLRWYDGAGANGSVYSKGNLSVSRVVGAWSKHWGSLGVSSGKWYWEFQATTLNSPFTATGIRNDITTLTANQFGTEASEYGYLCNGQKGNNSVYSAYGTSYTGANVIGIGLDLDNGKIFFAKDNTWQNTGDPVAGTNPAYSGLSGTFFPAGTLDSDAVKYNFGARPFTYTPPTGFKALNTANLPEGTAAAPATFNGNAAADGAYIAMNGTPETATINSNAVTWGTHADRVAGGMKLRTASASYNASGSNTLSCTFLTPNRKSVQKYQTAKGNP